MLRRRFSLLIAGLALSAVTRAADVGTALTYQGSLEKNGVPHTATCDFRFDLRDDPVAGNAIGNSPQTALALSVFNGVFTAVVDFGDSAFHGDARWLEIAVRCPGDAGYIALTPRQPLTPTPYALALPGLHTQQNGTSPSLIGGYSGNIVLAGKLGATISGGGSAGSVNQVTDHYGTIGGGINNLVSSNAATIAGGSDNVASSNSAFVGAGTANTANGSTSTISGGGHNTAGGGNSTIGGGWFNSAVGDDSTVGGGSGNSAQGTSATVCGGNANLARASSGAVCGGQSNTAYDQFCTVGGGNGNQAGDTAASDVSGSLATVGGGETNIASGQWTVVGGGKSNLADDQFATIAGGNANQATEFAATVPGGDENLAGGSYSFAAGRRAKARDNNVSSPYYSGDADGDEGTFVWADSTPADFVSSGPNQFLIRATGGVGIGTNAPLSALHALGADNNGTTATLQLESGSQTLLLDGNEIDSSTDLHLNNNNANHVILANGGGRVGIGDSTPDARLDVSEGGVVAIFNRQATDGPIVSFQQDNITEGSINVSGTTVTYIGFTGAHFAWTDAPIDRGTLVALTGQISRRQDNASAEPIYGIVPSTTANDPRCLGAYLGLVDPSSAPSLDNAHQVMAVGNGDMWVVDTGRDMQPGDYLISSDVIGHAMRDDPQRFPIGYVVARVAEPVEWSNVTDSMDGRKHKRISVFFESFERGQSAGLGAIVDTQRKEIEQLRSRVDRLEHAAAGGAVRAGLPLALIGTICLVALGRRNVNESRKRTPI